jgi:hypothetical protein
VVPYIGAVRTRAVDERRDEIMAVGDFVHADWAMVLEMPVSIAWCTWLPARIALAGAVADARPSIAAKTSR